MSSASEKISSFSRGSAPLSRHQRMMASPASIGGAEFGPEAGPAGEPVRRVAEEALRAERIRKHDQQIAAVIGPPFLKHPVGRRPELGVAVGQRRQHHRQLVRVGADRLEVRLHRQEHVAGADEALPEPLLHGLHAPSLPEKGMAPAGPEVGNPQVRQLLQPLHLLPHLRLGPGVDDVELEAAEIAEERPRAELADDRQRRHLPHHDERPRPVEAELELAVSPVELVLGKLEVLQPVQEVGAEDLLDAVEAVARQPDHLALAQAQRAGMVEMGAQLRLVDLVGQAHPARAVGEREGDRQVRMQPPNHLQHQELVEIGVEKAAHDRVELERVVPHPRGDVGRDHRFPSVCL